MAPGSTNPAAPRCPWCQQALRGDAARRPRPRATLVRDVDVYLARQLTARLLDLPVKRLQAEGPALLAELGEALGLDPDADPEDVDGSPYA